MHEGSYLPEKWPKIRENTVNRHVAIVFTQLSYYQTIT
jgi:hypothetical protein